MTEEQAAVTIQCLTMLFGALLGIFVLLATHIGRHWDDR